MAGCNVHLEFGFEIQKKFHDLAYWILRVSKPTKFSLFVCNYVEIYPSRVVIAERGGDSTTVPDSWTNKSNWYQTSIY